MPTKEKTPKSPKDAKASEEKSITEEQEADELGVDELDTIAGGVMTRGKPKQRADPALYGCTIVNPGEEYEYTECN